MSEGTPAGFAITAHKGFQITFANGYTVSVQFGAGNYCDNYNDGFYQAAKEHRYESSDAEVAVIRPDGEMAYLDDHSQVRGRQSPDEVTALIASVCAGTFKEHPAPDYEE
jgi:hypothetical protein